MAVAYFHPMRMADTILPGSPPWDNVKGRTNHFSLSSHFPTGQQPEKASQHDRAHILSLLPNRRKDQPTWDHIHSSSLSLSISSSPLNTMRRPHPIYGPLVFGKSFFHHSSFLLNQWILGETNWIFLTPAFNFSILIPVLMMASQFMLWHSVS